MPRTIRTKLYKFNELTTAAQEKAIELYRNECAGDEPAWRQENIESMKKFADMFPIDLTDWSVGGRGEGVSFRFTGDYADEIENLSGQRLSTYIWNNYKNQLYKGKYYSGLNGNKPVYHKRVRTETYKNGNVGNYYYSAITLDNSCPLTGYGGDMEILDPIYKFLKKPRDINFRDLLEECFEAWIKFCNQDEEYQQSDEYLKEEIEANDFEFTQDGKRF